MYETGASVVQGPSGKLMALVSARVRVVAAWLKSVELHESVGEDGIIVVVSHGAFLGMLIAELIGESKPKPKSKSN
jgi:broad specificity phosphatase PhoE